MAQEKFTIEKIDRTNKFTVLNDFLSKERSILFTDFQYY